jgi:hypothetical protein
LTEAIAIANIDDVIHHPRSSDVDAAKEGLTAAADGDPQCHPRYAA